MTVRVSTSRTQIAVLAPPAARATCCRDSRVAGKRRWRPSGQTHTFVLTPVPESTSVVLLRAADVTLQVLCHSLILG
jgi:hypothetical protein